MELVKFLVGRSADHEIGPAISRSVHVFGYSRSVPATPAAALGLTRLERRQSELAAHIVATGDRIIPSERVDEKPFRCSRVEPNRKAAVLSAVAGART
jgi:hypothetical protein